MLKAELDLSDVRRKITLFLKEKVEASQTDGVVFELGGGVNSAVAAYLCIEALGTRRVTGLLMPDLRLVSEEEIADAKNVADELCLDVEQFDVAPAHKAFMKSLVGNRQAEENLRARVRMSLLYYHANVRNRLVVGTGDRSQLLMGYFTKYGDGGADILPIADLYGSEVRKLGEVLGINRRTVTKKRSKRHANGQVAAADLDVDIEAADQIFRLRLDQGMDAAAIALRTGLRRSEVDAILSRYASSSHKRGRPEICSLH